MRPHLTPIENIRISVNYNEAKLKTGTAVRIKAENFLKDHDRLNRREIIERFRQRSSRDGKLGDEGVHFSLNFGKREALSNERLVDLTGRFMNGMGFEDQPYVVYRHFDAGHTHIHIVATSVRTDGKLIHLRLGDYHHSHALCRTLEKEFGLERSVAVTPDRKEEFAVDHAQKVVYGEPGLKRAVSDVLNTVFDHYNYTSLDEYNAILQQYNVSALRGNETSRLYQGGGLLYQTLDENGRSVGTPIKSSAFLVKPTLKNLEKKFEQNQALREVSRERLSTAIEWALAGRTPDWEGFVQNLEKDGIAVVTGKDDGKIFFVDHTGKSSFEGKSLGEDYRLEALHNRCKPSEDDSQELLQKQQLRQHL